MGLGGQYQDMQSLTSLHSFALSRIPWLICRLYIFFGEVAVKVFSLFFNQVVCFLMVGF